jgi:hypothetical protein
VVDGRMATIPTRKKTIWPKGSNRTEREESLGKKVFVRDENFVLDQQGKRGKN